MWKLAPQPIFCLKYTQIPIASFFSLLSIFILFLVLTKLPPLIFQKWYQNSVVRFCREFIDEENEENRKEIGVQYISYIFFYTVLVSRTFSAFEKETLEVAGSLGRRSQCEADLRLHLFRLPVNEPRSYNHVQGDNMSDSNSTFSCCSARVAPPFSGTTTGDDVVRVSHIMLKNFGFNAFSMSQKNHV